MTVNELSKEIGVKNKETITFLKDKGFNISSHMQNVTDEMIELAKAELKPAETETKVEEKVESVESETKKSIDDEIPEEKKFAMDDLIPCRSVTPWELIALGSDKKTVYHWEGYGDVDYIKYSDLQSLRRKDLIKAPKVIIEDASLCYQWRRELGDTYKYFLGVEYPEEFFDLSDAKFEELLKNAPDVVKEVIKVTALNMVKNENYPSVVKLTLIDNILGTCIKEFL
jgi:hypothetical protein